MRLFLKYAVIVLILLLGVSIGLSLLHKQPPSPVKEHKSNSEAASPETTSPEFRAVEQHYQMAIAELEQALSAQKSHLSPADQEEFTKNLQLIETSIQECKTLLQQHPDNQLIRDSLLELYRKKMDLLGQERDFSDQVKDWGKFFYWLWSL